MSEQQQQQQRKRGYPAHFNRKTAKLRRINLLLDARLLGRRHIPGRLVVLGRGLLGVQRLGVRLSCDVLDEELEGAGERLAALKDGEQADAEEGAEDPDDADHDPAGEELLGEDVAGAVHGHGPDDEEGEGLGEG